jgi:predicted ArsR family transcriptional regulator
LSATDLAERLALHPNTVRPHLDRMREDGLVEVEPIHRGTVGRPQLRYSLAPGAPGLGLDPPAHTLLAGLLAALAEQIGGDRLDAANLGRRWGTEASGRRQTGRGCLAALVAELDRLGFDPVESELGGGGAETRRVRVDFLHCPFRELAEAYPELVCHLHRGIVEGVVVNSARTGQSAGMVEDFRTLIDRDPCNVTVSVGYAESGS